MIVTIEDRTKGCRIEITDVDVIRNQRNDSGMQLANELKKYDCEALVTGELEPEVFNFIADACITRYNGAGYSVYKAIELMEKLELKLIRNTEGTDECDDSHHKH